ncbi:unnamed protein product [Paramecium primaurelia]|uniref:Uncharacterized protein n=1 Tax=Paramecium primaurelia TaxID=5886 RepID=A0A8S1P1G8_PARPR|nr:unnamed protein product [Paramecium primaurelia]CAD8094346.1 unnamed protein product [Paramecium primaurelia]
MKGSNIQNQFITKIINVESNGFWIGLHLRKNIRILNIQTKLFQNLPFLLAIRRLCQILRYSSQKSNEPCNEYFSSVYIPQNQIISSKIVKLLILLILVVLNQRMNKICILIYSKAFNLEHQVYLEQ